MLIKPLQTAFNVYLRPVVITTAPIYSTTYDISSCDLREGTIPAESLGLTPVPWLYYRYVQTPDTKHALSWTVAERGDPAVQDRTHTHPQDALSLGDTLITEYARSVAIVSSEHLGEFLRNVGE